MIACVEEIAYSLGYISAAEVAQRADSMKDNAYGQYLFHMLDQTD